jgi:hypothetical protein
VGFGARYFAVDIANRRQTFSSFPQATGVGTMNRVTMIFAAHFELYLAIAKEP